MIEKKTAARKGLSLVLLCLVIIGAGLSVAYLFFHTQSAGISHRGAKDNNTDQGNGRPWPAKVFPSPIYPAGPPDSLDQDSGEAGNLPPVMEPQPVQALAPVVLHEVSLRVFLQNRPEEALPLSGRFREKPRPLEETANLDMAERVTGPLSPRQRRYLKENRFLLIPAARCKGLESLSMLEMFRLIGKGEYYGDSPLANALYVGPDPFAHALSAYLSSRQLYIEQTRMSVLLARLLEGLCENAALLRESAGPASAESFGRLHAQFALPLAILRSALPGGENNASRREQRLLEEQAKEFGTSLPASRERTRELMRAYDMPERYASALSAEIEAIFQAGGLADSPLLSAQYGRPCRIDYRSFFPGERYADLPVLRSWHRAVRWLEHLRWDLEDDASAIDAVNFALLMSMPVRYQGGADGTPRPPGELWAQLMELRSFFSGFASEPGYPEWAWYLREQAGVDTMTAETAVSPGLLQRLRSGLPGLASFTPFFASVRRGEIVRRLGFFPRPFSLSAFLRQELGRHPDPERADLPERYSALWAAAVMGSVRAFELIPLQIQTCLTPLGSGTPLQPSPPGGSPGSPASPSVMGTLLEKAGTAMHMGIRRLGFVLGQEPRESWSASLDSAWPYLLRTLLHAPGKGTPLYMRGPNYGQKALETFLAGMAERERQSRVPATAVARLPVVYPEADASLEDTPVPDGFVEPVPAFWRGMLALTESAEDLFDAHGLLAEDRDVGGTLYAFQNQLGLCAVIAEKELKGKKVSRAEYELLRDSLNLSPMARPVEEGEDASLYGGEALALLQHGPAHRLYGATGGPCIMLVLAGDAKAQRVTVGVAYNHYEFVTGPHDLLDEALWRQWVAVAAEGGHEAPPLPAKPFWYQGLDAEAGSDRN